MKRILTLCLLLVVAVPLNAAEKKADADKAALVKSNNQFALDLYNQLRDKDGNLFFSPYSISTALGMTYEGARGKTATEMARALHFDLEKENLHPAFAAQLKDLTPGGKKPAYQLNVANALWGQKNYDFLPAFLATTKKHYGAGLSEVDFIMAREAARKTINAWVEEQTKNKIKDLLKPGVLTVDTRLVLTNAIYFKGNWASQFKKDRTREEMFRVTGDKTVKTPMMHQRDKFGYHEGEGFQMLELPYEGKDLSMVVLLPKKVDGLADLEKSLSADKLARWLGQVREQTAIVTLPKFKMTSEFQLNTELAKLGMKSAFTRAADFSGMNGRTDLFIQAVVHKAFVEVNEEGTEAAAATGVVVGLKSARVYPVFRADHPFLLLIRDKRSGSILFMGRLVNPQS